MKLYFPSPTNYKQIFAPTVYRFMHSNMCVVYVCVCVYVSSKLSNTLCKSVGSH